MRLQLFALAYNLGNFLRRLALPRSVKHWLIDDVAGQVDQDRRKGRPSFPLHRLLDSGGGHSSEAVHCEYLTYPILVVADTLPGNGMTVTMS